MTIDVKICGLGSPAEVEAASAGGARWFGMVFFAPSPRFVAPGAALALSQTAAGRVEPVGVYVDADDALLDETAGAVAWMQLHGRETPARAADIKARWGKRIIKAVRIEEASDVAAADAYAGVADMILFDAKPKPGWKLPGGNGQPFDWRLLAEARPPMPWMLSGGLTAENLEEAVQVTGAPAVDVSSGVEVQPGAKSVDKIFAFLDKARALAAEGAVP